MAIIRSHSIILRGGNEKFSLVLRPLTDEHLPYLYRWNRDPEVLYWTEGEEGLSYGPETVQQIYGSISQTNLCFILEVNGRIVGECWLQRMNLPAVQALYGDLDVRRIDMCIGEKEYWGRGIGTLGVGMLADFAFRREGAEVLHCMTCENNLRCNRVWEKNGFTPVIPSPTDDPRERHWRLTRAEYENRS